MAKNLYLFPAVYPYNLYGDNFLEAEMEYHFKAFDHIYIIPYRKETERLKDLPANCSVLPAILDGKYKFILKGIFSFPGAKMLLPDFFKNKAYKNRKRFEVWIKAYTFLNNLYNRKDIRNIGKVLTPNDVCYFYWGKWGNMLSVLWKGKAHFVSRFHGEWDLWEESYDGYTPLRNEVSSNLDLAAFISQKGEKYYKERYPQTNTLFAPLGTKDMGISRKSDDGITRIFTCSNIIPLKRVPLIFETINKFAANHKVEWVHIGGGEAYEDFKAHVETNKCGNLTALLLGQQDHSIVIEYYKDNAIDLFMNLSTTEGVPVSIMEAISCDVPVVATNVGGVSEVVTDETGKLVSSNPTVDEVVSAIEHVLSHHYNARDFWTTHYCADINYSRFVENLLKL